MNWADENRGWRERALDRFGPRAAEPLLVRAWLASPVAYDGFDPLTLEGTLQSIVVLRETGRVPDDVFADCPRNEPLENTDIPIPIVDTMVEGMPIAHASIGWFAPGATSTKRQGWKRADAEHYNRPTVKISEAGTKTQMVLKATVTALHVDFFVQADRVRLEGLLLEATHLGASRAGGLGEIQGWEIVDAPGNWWWYGPAGTLMRTLPLGLASAAPAGSYDSREATLRAPYWHPRSRRPAGVPVQRLGEPTVACQESEPAPVSTGDARASRFSITEHAVHRYRERVPGKRRLSYERALSELVHVLETARYLRTQANGLEIWRGRDRNRTRVRVQRRACGTPRVVTVLKGYDGA